MHTPSPTSVTSEVSEQSNQLMWRIDPIGFTRSAVATVDGFAVNIDVKPDPLGWMRYGVHKVGQFSKVQTARGNTALSINQRSTGRLHLVYSSDALRRPRCAASVRRCLASKCDATSDAVN